MASPTNTVTDEAGKARVIAHMNKDHTTDLAHILQHCNGLSEAAAADARMLDISFESITIESRSGTHVVKLDPPMKWEDRRQRLIDLTLAARAALGVPGGEEQHGGDRGPGGGAGGAGGAQVAMREYLPPRGFDIVVGASVAFYFFTFSLVRAGFVEPGRFTWEVLEKLRFPYGPQGFRWLVTAIAVPVLALHLGELWYMDRTRLAVQGIQRGNRVWWLWVGSTFFEGVRAFKRFDGAVRKQKARKAL